MFHFPIFILIIEPNNCLFAKNHYFENTVFDGLKLHKYLILMC